MEVEAMVLPSCTMFSDWRGRESVVAKGCGRAMTGVCQECYKNSALFAQFLLTSQLMFCYLISFAFIALTFTLPYVSFLSLMTSRTSRQGIHIYSVLENTYRTTRLQVLVILILWACICTLFPQTRSLCSVWGLYSVQTS